MASGWWSGSSSSSPWLSTGGRGSSCLPDLDGHGRWPGGFGIRSTSTSGSRSGSFPWSSQSNSSSTSSSSSSKRGQTKKHGSDWTYRLYFDPRADKEDNDIEEIEHEDLKEELAELVDVYEEIISVFAYKSALSDYQLTKILLFHVFIVFETKHWWWSIEKNTEGITLQRGRTSSSVKKRHLKEKRTQYETIELIEKDNARRGRTIKRLIKFLYDEEELYEKYDVYQSNCKHFGKKIFEFLSKEVKLHV